MLIDPGFWRDLKVVLTGHTGFKGAWLTLWLQRLGAEVSALALAPDREPSLYRLARVQPEREVIADLSEAGPIAAVTKFTKTLKRAVPSPRKTGSAGAIRTAPQRPALSC